MPFDIPYGAPISLDQAQTAIAAAVAEAKKRHWKLNVAVVDSGSNLVAFQRMDGAQLASIAVSQHKARSAAQYRRETKAFEDAIQLKQNYYALTLDGVIASRGGIPLVVGGETGRRDRLLRRHRLAGRGRLQGGRCCGEITGGRSAAAPQPGVPRWVPRGGRAAQDATPPDSRGSWQKRSQASALR